MKTISLTPTGRKDQKTHCLTVMKSIIDADAAGESFKLLCHGKAVVRQNEYVAVMKQVVELIERNQLQTKREFYYQNIDLFKSQYQCDYILERIQDSFKVPRSVLNIVAAPKAIILGPILFRLTNSAILDASNYEINLPTFCEIEAIKTSATTFAIVEKYATFHTLIQSDFSNQFPESILITAKGYPDISTREFLNQLSKLVIKNKEDWIEVNDDPFTTPERGVQSVPSVGEDQENFWSSDLEIETINDEVDTFWSSDGEGCVRQLKSPDNFWSSEADNISVKGEPGCNEFGDCKEFWLSDDECILQNSASSLKGFIVVDPDPHGIQIMLCYIYGTSRLDYLDSLTVPVNYVGIKPSQLKIEHITKALDLKERKFCSRILLDYKSLKYEIKREIQYLLLNGRKGEVESFDGPQLISILKEEMNKLTC